MKFYGFKTLNGASEWKDVVGASKWADGKSAAELAHAWQPPTAHPRGLPASVRGLFEACGEGVFFGVEAHVAFVERPEFLDTYKAPSMTDLLVICSNDQKQEIVIAVEGKVDETFDKPVSEWLRSGADEGVPTPTRARRLDFLCGILRREISPTSNVRYQLLHRTVSAVIEAEKRGAAAAVVLVHSFTARVPDPNFADFNHFLVELGVSPSTKDALSRPVNMGNKREVPVYFAWVDDRPRAS